MARTLLTMVLLAAVTQAQVENAVPKKDPIWEHIQAERTQRVLADPQYTELRSGTEEGFFITAKIEPAETGKPPLYWGAPSPRNGRVAASELEIDIPNGFTVHSVHYGPLKRVALEAGAPSFFLGPNKAEFHFKLRADRNLAVGDYLLKGKLRFQPIGKAGVLAAQELQFDIPVRLVDHKAKVSKNMFYSAEMTAADWIRVILLMPLFPFFIPNC